MKSLEDHHVNYHFSLNHPVAICVSTLVNRVLSDAQQMMFRKTDDTLPFRNSLLGEYAMLLAQKPVGLGLDEEDVRTVARMSMDSRFVALKRQ